jgi:hypothetical protein
VSVCIYISNPVPIVYSSSNGFLSPSHREFKIPTPLLSSLTEPFGYQILFGFWRISLYCFSNFVKMTAPRDDNVRNMECTYDNQPSFEHKMPNIYNAEQAVTFWVQPVISDRYDQRDYMGWPLLTVENEALGIGDSKSTNERGPSLVGSLGPSWPAQEILAALVGPVQSIFFFAVHYFN